MRYCKKCGSQVREEDNFCSKCGTSLRNSKIGYIRRASIGPHPVWSIISGVMLVLSGFVSIYLLATAFEPLPIPFKLSLILVFTILIAIGVILFVSGIRGKIIPTLQVESKWRCYPSMFNDSDRAGQANLHWSYTPVRWPNLTTNDWFPLIEHFFVLRVPVAQCNSLFVSLRAMRFRQKFVLPAFTDCPHEPWQV